MNGTSARDLKILFVDTEKVWRGGQEQIFGLMLGLRARGHDVILAAPDDSPLATRSADAGIQTLDFRQRHELSISAPIRIWRIIKSREFDVLHLNTPRTLISAGLAAAITKTPVVSSRRVDFPLKSRLSALKYNRLVDVVLAISSSIQRTLAGGGVKPGLTRVIYEGVDLDWLANQKLKDPAPDGRETVIGTVAALTPEKGHNFLIDAARIVTANTPGVRFILVGEGSERSVLELQAASLGISDNIIFTGFRSDSEALTQRFDIFCLPTLSEGLSSAIMVAMAQSVPVIATAVGGIPELVVDGKTGLLVPPADVGALAAALEKLLKDPLLRKEMGKEGHRRIREEFTVKQKLDATEKVYLELLTTKRIR